MANEKGLSEIVCDAVKDLQEPIGSSSKAIYAYVKDKLQSDGLSKGKLKLGLKNAIDKGKLTRTYDGKFKLNVPNVTADEVKQFKDNSKHIMLLKANCGCPKPRRRRSKCRSRSRRRRSKQRRKKRCRSCTPIWVPKRKRRRRSSRRCRSKRSRRRRCGSKRRRQKRCRSCTPIWVPKRKKRCRK